MVVLEAIFHKVFNQLIPPEQVVLYSLEGPSKVSVDITLLLSCAEFNFYSHISHDLFLLCPAVSPTCLPLASLLCV